MHMRKANDGTAVRSEAATIIAGIVGYGLSHSLICVSIDRNNFDTALSLP